VTALAAEPSAAAAAVTVTCDQPEQDGSAAIIR